MKSKPQIAAMLKHYQAVYKVEKDVADQYKKVGDMNGYDHIAPSLPLYNQTIAILEWVLDIEIDEGNNE